MAFRVAQEPPKPQEITKINQNSENFARQMRGSAY